MNIFSTCTAASTIMMKALLQNGYGNPTEVLSIAQVPRPTIDINSVLVRVVSTSGNTPDWAGTLGIPYILRLGSGIFRPKKKQILCTDVAGIIEEEGKQVTNFQPGDEVFGSVEKGAFAEGISTPLQLLETNGYRYMACESPLTAPATIIRAPLESCITADSTYALADRLAYERSLGASSQYAPYIDVLPTLEGSLATLPRFWSSDRIENVNDGNQLIKKAGLFEDKGLDPWALACVNSRCNYLLGGSYSLTPLLDMLNHKGSIRTSASIADGELSLQVDCCFATGDEVFISYGDLANLDTLWDYGFVAADNPYNAETVDVQIIRQPSLEVTVAADGSIQNSALTKLRRYLATTQEMDEQRQRGNSILAFSKPISERNEMDVFAFLATEINEAASEAKSGARELEEGDLARTYLHERSKTLQKGLDAILERYPDLEY